MSLLLSGYRHLSSPNPVVLPCAARTQDGTYVILALFFYRFYLLVRLIYSFQSVIKMKCDKGGKHCVEKRSSSPKKEGRLSFLSAFA